jgi:hypothetical protein
MVKITLIEAENIIASTFLSSNELRLIWNELSESDKLILINKSFLSISKLRLRKTKSGEDDYKLAQVYEALSFLDSNDALEARRNNIQTETIGKMSTSYFKVNNDIGISSLEARQILKKYIIRTGTIG